MSEDFRWRYRRQGLLVGLLLAGVVAGLTYAATRPGPVVRLSEQERRVLVETKWVERRVVDRVEVEIPVEVVKHVTRTERVEVPVPGQTVEVVRTVESGCDPGPVEIGGVDGLGCTVERIEAGGEIWARARWSCRAAGPGWEATRGPEQVPDVRFESSPPGRPVLARLLELRAGPFADTRQFGGRVGLTWVPRGRRLGWWGDLDVALDPVRDSYGADDEPTWRAAGGVALRVGR